MSLPELTEQWHKRHREIQRQQQQQLQLQREQEQRQMQQLNQHYQQDRPIQGKPIRSIHPWERFDLDQRLVQKQCELDEVLAKSAQSRAAQLKIQSIFETFKLK